MQPLPSSTKSSWCSGIKSRRLVGDVVGLMKVLDCNRRFWSDTTGFRGAIRFGLGYRTARVDAVMN